MHDFLSFNRSFFSFSFFIFVKLEQKSLRMLFIKGSSWKIANKMALEYWTRNLLLSTVSLRVVVANVMACNIVVSGFDFQSAIMLALGKF